MYLDKPLRIDSIGRKFAKKDGVTHLDNALTKAAIQHGQPALG